MNYGGHYRNTPAHLAFQAKAEGLHLVENLVVNKEQRIPDIDAFRTTPDPVSGPRFLLVHGQEFHTGFWGHTALLGLQSHYLLPDYAGQANTAAASLVPTNADVADLAHAQGALMGYVHPFDTAVDPDNTDGDAQLRAAGGRRPGQARLPRGDGVQRPPHHLRRLVPPAQLRLPHSRRRRHGRVPELRLAARARRPAAHVRPGGPAPRAPRLPRRPARGAARS